MIKRYGALIPWASLAIPSLAFAHTSIKGIDSFYNGLLHPVLVPAHLLLLIAIGLFLGQQGPKENEMALVAFAVATLVGLVGAWFFIGSGIEIIILGGAAAVGLLVAASPVVGLFWSSLIAILGGLAIGMDSTQDTLSGQEKLIALFGSGVGIFFLLLYPIALADYFKKKEWQKIGVRVIGAWVAASALMVLALTISAVQ